MFSSCAILDGTILPGSASSNATSTGGTTPPNSTVTVNGGDTNNITISSTNESTALAASKALLSTVSVNCYFDRAGFFSDGTGGGAGVIYKLDKESGDAYIITNYHVVYDAYINTANHISDDIKIYLYGLEATKYAIPATYVGGSMTYDIAILKVEDSKVLMESEAVAVSVASSDEVSVLDTAIAIGNPDLRGISATVGYVNVDSEEISLNMTVSGISVAVNIRVMRTDAAVNGGNSGGGLFNIYGELIGIVNAKRAVDNIDDDIDNIGYAIPSDLVRAVADNIIAHCSDTSNENLFKATLGISTAAFECDVDYDTETGDIIKSDSVMVSAVTEGSAADGKLESGDVLKSLSINGKEYKLTRYYHASEALLDARLGDTVVITVLRGTEEIEVSFTVTEDMMLEKA